MIAAYRPNAFWLVAVVTGVGIGGAWRAEAQTGGAPDSGPAAPRPSAAKDAKRPENPKAKTTYFASERLRVENWDWFATPKANGGYTFLSSLLRAGVYRTTPTDDLMLEFEQPTLMNLPKEATMGPPIGSLGLGGLYFGANHEQNGSLFIKQGYAKFKRLGNNPADSLKIGRFEFADGAETTPADELLAYVKSTRLNERLLSPAAFTETGRAFDGFQFSSDTRLLNVTALGAVPTRGVFDLNGWDDIPRIQVGYLSSTFSQPGKRDVEERLFGVYYGDQRNLTVLDPPSSHSADKHGVHLGTFGADYIRAFDLGRGRVDTMLWGAGQIGSWGLLTQAAYAWDAEVGYQLPRVAWKPWLRLGYSFMSGDGNPSSSTHGTFIPLLTTQPRFSPFPFYTFVNMRDLVGQLILKPDKKVTLRAEIHGLKLANSHDLWYSGGGAYDDLNFGYTGRPSGGKSDLGTFYDIVSEYRATRSLTMTLFLGYVHGGDVEAVTFPGRDAAYTYIEAKVKF